MSLQSEIARRRTFAIISHPDAGKTTLTEKFLLYSGQVQLAGAVTARRKQRATVSDWMELERQRGISITSTVLQFEYGGYAVNLLDTPGHNDFSEDTYRVLMAVDAAVMVVDGSKGIESQTRKLFEVCRRRNIPIFTFINKLDRPVRDPLALLDEVEAVLGIQAYAVNWPVGLGFEFQGVYDRMGRQLHLFERTQSGAYRAPVEVSGFGDPAVSEKIPEDTRRRVTEELEVLEGAGATFEQAAIHGGKLTPVFFGSAVNNFGVQLLLDGFLRHAVPPAPRQAACGIIPTDRETFSGFVFKIQANMDPNHRDRLASIRVCSGKFTRGMTVLHVQSGRKLRLASRHRLFGQDRDTLDEAYPGDIIGVVGHSDFRVGDTVTEDPAIVYDEIARFPSECFAYLHCAKPSMARRFQTGVAQLLQEGVVQLLHRHDSTLNNPLLGAIGPLQFEVVQHRLLNEYGAESRLERRPWTLSRWIATPLTPEQLEALVMPTDCVLARDVNEQPVILFATEWALNYFKSNHKHVELSDKPNATAPGARTTG